MTRPNSIAMFRLLLAAALLHITVNGRSTYFLPRVGSQVGHCTYFYPSIPLKITDLVDGYEENGNLKRQDWHGYSKAKHAVAWLAVGASAALAVRYRTQPE